MKNLAIFLFAVITGMIFASRVSAVEGNKKYIWVAEEWIESIHKITPGLLSQEISNTVEAVEKNLVIGKILPGSEAIKILKGEKTANAIFLIVIMEDDKKYLNDWKEIAFYSPAQFLPAMRSIIIDGEAKYSFAGKAIALSREYYRAYRIMNNLCSAKQYWHMEFDAQTFQDKFLSFLGGKKYVDLVHNEADALWKEVLKDGSDKFTLFNPKNYEVYDERLNSIIGETKSREEMVYIQNVVWTHTALIFIQKTAKKGRAWEEKVNFLKTLNFYKEGSEPRDSIDYPDYDIFRNKDSSRNIFWVDVKGNYSSK